MDFYAVLGIARDADDPKIRNAYRILARRYHPDTGDDSSGERFRRIAEAYETLIDPGRRRKYDLSLRPSEVPTPIRVESTYARFDRRPFVVPDDPINELIRSLEDDLFFLMWR